jgi:hypothetical protein
MTDLMADFGLWTGGEWPPALRLIWSHRGKIVIRSRG